MGWASANDIFDPVCEEVVRLTQKGDGMYPIDATQILTVLIKQLQAHGWDTEGESLGEFARFPYVVEAFANNDIRLGNEDA